MKTTYNYERQTTITRNVDGKIKSIKPMFDRDTDPFSIIDGLIEKETKMANKFPLVKLRAEMDSIPEKDFKVIKEELAWKGNLTDHGSKCYYQPTTNSVVILHKQI